MFHIIINTIILQYPATIGCAKLKNNRVDTEHVDKMQKYN